MKRWDEFFQFWEENADQSGKGCFQFGALLNLVETVGRLDLLPKK
jgi:hypothetical protein